MLDVELPPLEIQHAWFQITHRSDWNSIVLIPASDDIQTIGLAHAFGQMAVRDPHDDIWVVNTGSGSNKAFEKFDPKFLQFKSSAYPYKLFDLGKFDIPPEAVKYAAEELLTRRDNAEPQQIRVIFAVDSLLNQTHTISLCRQVDKVVLCAALGRTQLESARRIVEIVGKEKVLGCVAFRPSVESSKEKR